MILFTECPGCQAKSGDLHETGCDIEQCPSCGGHCTDCFCDNEHLPRLAYDGELPGMRAARHFGWFTRYTDAGWERCSATDEGAAEDIHRVQFEACWVPERRDWERSPNQRAN